jgi:rubrerythrin
VQEETIMGQRIAISPSVGARGGKIQLGFPRALRVPACTGCGYLLYMTQSDACPECGAAIHRDPAPV